MPRFVLHPGQVTSENDGQRHYIGPGKLMELYQLTLEERRRSVVPKQMFPYHSEPDDIHLHPRFHGDYSRFWEVDT